MTLETRRQVFEDILTFHVHAAKQGYVVIDFYDGSIMYDFNNKRTVICDIDFYSKAPYINNMGGFNKHARHSNKRMWTGRSQRNCRRLHHKKQADIRIGYRRV